jgi:hypothetical protein
MEENMYPHASKDLAQKRRDLAPEIYGAFRTFGQRVFADGALPSMRCIRRQPRQEREAESYRAWQLGGT